MNDGPGLDANGCVEARYLAFLETITSLRPAQHRYCARMTGSVVDGEDVVQEALFQAYRKLETFDDARPLKAWLFQIAHNRCIDLLRRRKVRQQAEQSAMQPDVVHLSDPAGPFLDRAVERLVLTSCASLTTRAALDPSSRFRGRLRRHLLTSRCTIAAGLQELC
jgi:RNA polymerase sigma-70 factor, ECF subfamily